MNGKLKNPLSAMLTHASWVPLYLCLPIPRHPFSNLRSQPSSLEIEGTILYSSLLPIGLPYLRALSTASSSGVVVTSPRSITM